MVKILITGGCGFIGSNLIEYLLKNTTWELVILDNLSEGKLSDIENLNGFKKRCEFINGDVRKETDVDSAVKGCDFVVHLAAQVGVMSSVEDPEDDAETNILGTINVLNACVDKKVKRFILASSAAPLGDQEMPITEEKVPQPMSPYGASKLACEGYCSAFSASYGLDTTALRFSNAYGPKSYSKGSVIPIFVRHILDGKPVTIYGDGDQTRDFLHAHDIARAIHLALTKTGLGTFELIQIGSAQETSINELYAKLKSIFEGKGYAVDSYHVKARKGEIRRSYCDISKAKRLLGFRPQIGLDSGLKQTVEWFLKDFDKDEDIVEDWA